MEICEEERKNDFCFLFFCLKIIKLISICFNYIEFLKVLRFYLNNKKVIIIIIFNHIPPLLYNDEEFPFPYY